MSVDWRPGHRKRLFLPLTSVQIKRLDEQQNVIGRASGFLRKVGNNLYLYTCWHVATGFDPFLDEAPSTPPRCRYFEVFLQNGITESPGIEVVGGSQSFVVPLFEEADGVLHPRWEQDAMPSNRRSVSEASGITLPFWHDAIRIAVPSGVHASDLVVVQENDFATQTPKLFAPGDLVLVVGYPYGYSVLGENQPTPVVLSRRLAATSSAIRGQKELLLDGPGFEVMSGGPVFIWRGESVDLLGLYVGVVFPDQVPVGEHRAPRSPDRIAALGRCCDLSRHLEGGLAFSPYRAPSESYHS